MFGCFTVAAGDAVALLRHSVRNYTVANSHTSSFTLKGRGRVTQDEVGLVMFL